MLIGAHFKCWLQRLVSFSRDLADFHDRKWYIMDDSWFCKC